MAAFKKRARWETKVSSCNLLKAEIWMSKRITNFDTFSTNAIQKCYLKNRAIKSLLLLHCHCIFHKITKQTAEFAEFAARSCEEKSLLPPQTAHSASFVHSLPSIWTIKWQFQSCERYFHGFESEALCVALLCRSVLQHACVCSSTWRLGTHQWHCCTQ